MELVLAPDGVAARTLLQTATSADTLDLRIIGVFVVFIAGFAGAALPLVSKIFKDPGHPATLMLRAASAGVILALAIIHVLPEGMTELGQLHAYPFCPLAVTIGVLVMILTENLSRSFMRRAALKGQQLPVTCGHDHAAAAAATQAEQGHGGLHQRQHQNQNQNQCSLPTSSAPVEASKPSSVQDGGGCELAQRGLTCEHGHACIAVNNAANWAKVNHGNSVRLTVLAYMFELACITHSVLIGIALGVITDSRQHAMVMTLALVFHQLLEGVGLGSTLVRAGFSVVRSLTMIATYALMTPVGTAIGIGIADAYDPTSVTALAVQGSLNSLSAGLLLYIGLVQLIAEDFTREDLQEDRKSWVRAGMHLSLLGGVALMAVIGNWA